MTFNGCRVKGRFFEAWFGRPVHLIAAGAILCAVCNRSGLGQEALTPMLPPGTEVISMEDIEVLKSAAGLSDEEFEGIKLLMEGYGVAMAEVDTRTQRIQETAEMKTTGWNDPAFQQQYTLSIAKQLEQVTQLERGILADLQSVLTSEQRAAGWATFERKRRLRVMLPMVQTPLANCMLTTVVDEVMKAPPPAAVGGKVVGSTGVGAAAGSGGVVAAQETAGKSAGATESEGADTDEKSTESGGDNAVEKAAAGAAASIGGAEDVARRAEIVELLKKYEEEIDAALMGRRAVGLYYNRWDQDEQTRPFEQQKKRFEGVRDADKRLFEIQLKYIKLLSSAMNPAQARTFEKKIRVDHLSFIYKSSRRHKRMQEVLRVQGLQEERVVQMKAIIDRSQVRVAALQDAFFEEWQRTEFRRSLVEDDIEEYANWDAFRLKRRGIEEEALQRLTGMLDGAERTAYDAGILKKEKKGDGAKGEAQDD